MTESDLNLELLTLSEAFLLPCTNCVFVYFCLFKMVLPYDELLQNR